MDIAEIIPLADGMHGGAGWWIVWVLLMLLMMGGMMWMMLRGMGGGSSPPGETRTTERPTTESPLEILERRFAEGAISIEEYRARRGALVDGTTEPSTRPEDTPDDTPLIAARAGDGDP